MSFAIVTDSLAGLPLAQIARRGLVVIPLSYTISGKEHLCLAPEGYDSAAWSPWVPSVYRSHWNPPLISR